MFCKWVNLLVVSSLPVLLYMHTKFCGENCLQTQRFSISYIVWLSEQQASMQKTRMRVLQGERERIVSCNLRKVHVVYLTRYIEYLVAFGYRVYGKFTSYT